MMRLFLSVAIVAIIKMRHSTSQQERKIDSQTNLARTLKMPNSMTLLTSLRKYRDYKKIYSNPWLYIQDCIIWGRGGEKEGKEDTNSMTIPSIGCDRAQGRG